MKAIPVPLDFKRRAAEMTLYGLRKHYGRSDQTIRRWCFASGVEPKPGRKLAARPWKFVQYDTPEEIRMCLHCAFPDCRGWCSKMAAKKSGKGFEQ